MRAEVLQHGAHAAGQGLRQSEGDRRGRRAGGRHGREGAGVQARPRAVRGGEGLGCPPEGGHYVQDLRLNLLISTEP